MIIKNAEIYVWKNMSVKNIAFLSSATLPQLLNKEILNVRNLEAGTFHLAGWGCRDMCTVNQ